MRGGVCERLRGCASGARQAGNTCALCLCLHQTHAPPPTPALQARPKRRSPSAPRRPPESAGADAAEAQQRPSYLPPPESPGRKSTLLAVCPHLPPSMQRAEWCMDDFEVGEKLYKGYASVGEPGLRGFGAAGPSFGGGGPPFGASGQPARPLELLGCRPVLRGFQAAGPRFGALRGGRVRWAAVGRAQSAKTDLSRGLALTPRRHLEPPLAPSLAVPPR